MKQKRVYTIGIFILLLITGGNTHLPANNIIIEMNDMNEMNETNIQESVITAKELYDAFKKDEASAIEKYGNKTITIKGFAVFVGPDVYALPSVELSEKKRGKSRILCVLPFSDYFKLSKVSKDDEVVITGEVRGFYEKGDQVLLKQCKIDKVTK